MVVDMLVGVLQGVPLTVSTIPGRAAIAGKARRPSWWMRKVFYRGVICRGTPEICRRCATPSPLSADERTLKAVPLLPREDF
jgi:hypothetical protein